MDQFPLDPCDHACKNGILYGLDTKSLQTYGCVSPSLLKHYLKRNEHWYLVCCVCIKLELCLQLQFIQTRTCLICKTDPQQLWCCHFHVFNSLGILPPFRNRIIITLSGKSMVQSIVMYNSSLTQIKNIHLSVVLLMYIHIMT